MHDPKRFERSDTVFEVHDPRSRRYVNDRFDRMVYARRVLDTLRARFVDVLLFESTSELRVERGRCWAAGPPYTWAVVGVSPNATREEIALCLLEVAGVEQTPFVLQTLLAL
jgi:hypothetical protein